jgi:hypothetical protein
VIKLGVVALVVVAAVVTAWLVQRRRPSPPTNPSSFGAPAQLDRADFDDGSRPWLVVVFTSATCDSCGDVAAKARILESDEVAVVEAEVGTVPELHQRYGIEAVPICVLADADGTVLRSFIGPVSSTHLWAALAELRDPGSVPDGCGESLGGTSGGALSQ